MGTNMSARRNILLLMVALSVLLSAACTEFEGPDGGWTELNGDRPVLFSLSVPTTTTKTSSTLPYGTTFGVFAFSQPGSENSPGTWNSSQTPNLMFNQAVTFNSDGSYTYAPTKYWPKSSYNTVSFWAYCPYNPTDDNIAFIQSGTTDTPYSATTPGFPDIKYTTNTGTTDLLAADPVLDQSRPANNDPVNFNFHHALSKINFKVQKADGTGDEYTIKLKSLSFYNLFLTGIHGSSHWRDLSNASSELNPFVVYNGTPVITAASSTPVSPNYTVKLIPQAVADNSAVLHIVYTVQLNSAPEEEHEGDFLLTGDWIENKEYTYTITISPGDSITFTASIADWDDEIVNGYYYIVD